MMYFPPRYDHNHSLELLKLVQQAYEQFHAFEEKDEWSLSEDYEMIRELDISESKADLILREGRFIDRKYQELMEAFGAEAKNLPIGFIAKKKSELYIIFRGTKTSMEWFQNLNFKLKPYLYPDYGNVHEGFLSVYRMLRKEIFDELKKIKIKRISVAGHSLGGALSTLLAPDLIHEGYKSVRIYTYGSPRVGDNEFVQAYNARFAACTFRIVNTSDLVVDVPFPAPFLGVMGGHFTHVDTPVVFTVQKDDIELNHKVATYLETLSAVHVPWSFWRWLSR